MCCCQMALWGSFAFKPAQLFIPVWFQSGSPGLHTANHSGEHVHRLRPCLAGRCSECLREGSAVCCSGSYSGVFIWAHVRHQAAAGHDAGRHWPRARNKWPPPLRRRDENPCWKWCIFVCSLSGSLLVWWGLKVWNSLSAGYAAWKSPREFHLMISLLPAAKRLLNADGPKVSRYLFHVYLGHFPSLSLFHRLIVPLDDDSRFTSLRT